MPGNACPLYAPLICWQALALRQAFFWLTKNCRKATLPKTKEQMVCDKFLFKNKKIAIFRPTLLFLGSMFELAIVLYTDSTNVSPTKGKYVLVCSLLCLHHTKLN